jgi:hypothetical protein
MESMPMIVKIKENWFWPLAIMLLALAWTIGQFSQIEPDSSGNVTPFIFRLLPQKSNPQA